MCIIEIIDWSELLIGGIIGTLIGLFAQRILDRIFGYKNLRPLIGEYTATYKNGKASNEFKEIRVTKYKGRVLFIETEGNKKDSFAKSEIYFHTPHSGNGWYTHTNINKDKVNDAFGLREIIKIDNNKLAVWKRYTKDGAYKVGNSDKSDSRMFSSIEQSYIWHKKK